MLIDYDMEKTLQRRHNRENAQGLAPVNLRITISGKRCDLSTGVSCPAAYWPAGAKKLLLPADKKLQVLPAFSANAISQLNEDLENFQNTISEVYKRLRKPDPLKPSVPVTVEEVRDAVRPKSTRERDIIPIIRQRTALDVAQEFIKTKQETPPESRATESTLTTYRTRRNTLGRYLAVLKTPNLSIEAIDVPWARRYERWLLTEAGGHAPLSMRKQINFLQLVLDFAACEGWVKSNILVGYPFQAKLAPPEAVSLPVKEVAMLAEILPDLDLPARRAAVGWLFCCYTGFSWVDYRRFCRDPAAFLFTDADPDTGQPRYWIRMVRQKMKDRKPRGFSVPLFDAAAELLLTWRGRLPHTHLVNANRLLGRIEQELHLSQPLTTKLARATFSQLRRDEGYSDEAVAAMMGDTVSVMNRHYSRVSERRIALEMNRIILGSPMHVAA